MKYLPLLLLLAGGAFADVDVRLQEAEMFPADVAYDPAIPTPEAFLGFKLGHEPVRHHQLVDYITQVAELSDRLSIEVIGYSHERRPILFLVATSKDNHANLDAIRERHLSLSGNGTAPADLSDMPMVTWLNYGVHGAESSGMDSALPFVYHLAAAQSDALDEVLRDSVVLVTAIFNPDGHAKRVAWFDTYGGVRRIGDPRHLEHTFSWALARTNHYWFDLNRQWLLLTQPEAQAWMRKWHEWRPNLTVDYHEMGSSQTYYFHPGVATRTNPLAMDEAERLMAETAKFSESVLDAEGVLYYQGERFDNYYVGKGSTFPLVNGGVGILYEAAAALGREIETPNGLRTFRENIRKQFRTSIASIEAGLALREEYLAYQRDFYTSAISEADRMATKAWVFTAGDDVERINIFADKLRAHRIDVEVLDDDLVVDGDRYTAGRSLLVRMRQPQHRLIRSIFETVDTFEDATFYDVSTWTMPLAFDLDYAALDARGLRSVRSSSHEGDLMLEETELSESGYGYVMEWDAYYAPRALGAILETGLLARVATKPFQVETSEGPKRFERGSVMVPLDRQTTPHDEIFRVMQAADAVEGVRVHALQSGRSVNGTQGVNVGGPSFIPLTSPGILLLTGDNVSRYDAGEIWHLLDYRMNIPVTLVDAGDFNRLQLENYSHILMPSGRYGDLGDDGISKLDRWVKGGGTVVAFRSAATWLQGELVAEDADDAEADEEEASEDERFDYAEKESRDAVDVIGGAIFAGDLDITHPVGFGYRDRDIALHRNMTDTLEASDNPYAVVIAYKDEPLLSGYSSDDNVDDIAGTPALLAERRGRGSVILFADNPNFRGYWYGTNKLFLNSLFFSRSFSAP